MSILTAVSTKKASISTSTATELVALDATRVFLQINPANVIYVGGSGVDNTGLYTNNPIIISGTGAEAAFYALGIYSGTDVTILEVKLL